jgi:hypothetical protein
MPKVVYSDSKGLVQESGSGFSFVTGTVADQVGLHLYQEEVELANDVNGDVVGKLSKKLPQNCIILQASLTVSSAGTAGSCELRYHTAAQNLSAVAAGTIIVGADAANNTSVPDADLLLTTAGKTVVDLTPRDVINKVYLHIAANTADITGSPKVLVSILYAGKGEPEVI